MNTPSTLKLPIIIVTASVAIGAGLVAYAFLHNTPAVFSAAVPVSRMNLSEEVTSSGKVKAAEEISLSFDRAGRVTSLVGDVGTSVTKGQAIATVSGEDLQAQLLQAQAALEREQIKLAKLSSGDTSSDNSSSSDVQTTISNNRTNVADKVTDGYTKLDSALGTYIDKFFSNARTYPNFGITATQSGGTYSLLASAEMTAKVNAERSELSTLVAKWDAMNKNLTTDASVAQSVDFGETTLVKAQTFLADIATIVNANSPVDATGQTLYAGYRSDVNSARTLVDSALSNLRTATQGYASAQSTVSPYELDLQKSAVKNAQAQVDVMNAQINKGVIYAPISGVITDENIKVGEVASLGTPVIKIMSQGKFEIETYVSEADISKVKMGTVANIILDAYGPQSPFTATVLTIDPAQTLVDGVGAYKTTLQFDNENALIKQGMTAEISFEISTRQNVLAIPDTAIIRKNNDTFVLVEQATSTNMTTERKVETGIHGTNGYTEIMSGLNEGEKIFTFGK